MLRRKDELRLELIKSCAKISDSYKTIAAKQLVNSLLPLINQSSKIALYHAHGHEISLSYVIEYCQSLASKTLYQPRASKKSRHMYFELYDDNQRNIFTVDNNSRDDINPYLEWYNLDLIILPLVGVDKSGVRLGRGGGYYDFTLKDIVESSAAPILCGVGYQCQLLEDWQVPDDNWDIRLNYFASEHKLLDFAGVAR